jgi:hypothetical protein
MAPPEVWGPAVWTLLHTMAEKINEQVYPMLFQQIFFQIQRICKFLPCPECARDATIFLAKIKIHNLKNKNDFKNLFYIFHNYVNNKKKKQLFNYSNINIYKKYNLIHVINNFLINYNTKGNMNLITESFQRQITIKDFKKWMSYNIKAFYPPRIPISVNEQKNKLEEAKPKEETNTKDPFINCCGENINIQYDELVSENIDSEKGKNNYIEEIKIEETILDNDNESEERILDNDNEGEETVLEQDNEIEETILDNDNESEETILDNNNENEETILEQYNEGEETVLNNDNESEEIGLHEENEREETVLQKEIKIVNIDEYNE